MIIERMEGDHGLDAAVDAVQIVDVNGDPVIAGELTLVIGQFMSGAWDSAGTPLLSAAMVHQGGGTWRWLPGPGDLQVGLWRLQLIHSEVAIPSDQYGKLLVRPRLPIAEG